MVAIEIITKIARSYWERKIEIDKSVDSNSTTIEIELLLEASGSVSAIIYPQILFEPILHYPGSNASNPQTIESLLR